jgi:hypothetical protein
MKNKVYLALIPTLIWISTIQAEPWKKSLDFGFNISQNSYSNNWAGGEAGNIAWTMLSNGIFEKQMSPLFNFKNTSQFQFGQTHNQDKTTKDWQRPIKTTDKIDIENVGRFTLHSYVDPYVALRFESQFLDNSVEPVKRLINPILLTESAGISRMIYSRDKDQFITRLGFSVRENLNRAVVDLPARKTKMQTATDGGIESVTDLQFKLTPTINYIGKLTLFQALFYSRKNDFKGTPQQNYWKAIDINFENNVSVALWKFIGLSFYAQLLYDKQIALGGRFKENLGLSLTYKMI